MSESTERATSAAIPSQIGGPGGASGADDNRLAGQGYHDETRDISEAEVRGPDHVFPNLAERDGRFYAHKAYLGGSDSQIPDSVHADAYHEVRLAAENNGWRVTDDDSYLVDLAANNGTTWGVVYSVPVEPNTPGNQE
jgi:hypothetical protein